MGCTLGNKVDREARNLYDAGLQPLSGTRGGATSSSCKRSEKLETPSDDVVTNVMPFGDSSFILSGVDGWVYVYTWKEQPRLLGKFRAHKKETRRLLPFDERSVLTSSADATVRLWALRDDGTVLQDAASEGAEVLPIRQFEGHRMSVSALELLGTSCPITSAGRALFTGSRDCTVRLWDLETGQEVNQAKILRNVVTAVRRAGTRTVVQASEDLQLRIWDCGASASQLQVAHAVRAGPNQLICLDVTDDGNYVVCGSKGFSRENCEVKVFDIRGGLRELKSVPCADQTIEALCMTGPETVLIASKDGYVRGISLLDVTSVCERGPASAGYTSLGVYRREGAGPVALGAIAGPDGPELELYEWQDADLFLGPNLLAASK